MRKPKSILADLLYVLRDVRHRCVEAQEPHISRRKILCEHEGGNKNA